VLEGALVCEDALVPADVLVRSEALREGRNDEPTSVADEAIECLLAWLRAGGAVSTLGGLAYWLGARGESLASRVGVTGAGAGGRLGGADSDERAAL
jgi:hypothetical protein